VWNPLITILSNKAELQRCFPVGLLRHPQGCVQPLYWRLGLQGDGDWYITMPITVLCILSLLSIAAIRLDMVFIVIINACWPCGPCTSVWATHVYVNNNKCIYGMWLLQCVHATEESRYIGDMAIRRSLFFVFLKNLFVFWSHGRMGSIGPGMPHFSQSLTSHGSCWRIDALTLCAFACCDALSTTPPNSWYATGQCYLQGIIIPFGCCDHVLMFMLPDCRVWCFPSNHESCGLWMGIGSKKGHLFTAIIAKALPVAPSTPILMGCILYHIWHMSIYWRLLLLKSDL